MSVNLKSLIGKLNPPTRKGLENAAGLCLSRTHYDVEIEHFLLKLLDDPEGDLARIAGHFGVDASRLTGELERSLDQLKSGNARTPAFSPTLVQMLTGAWTTGSIDYDAGQIRSGFAILALATEDKLVRLMRDVSREFQKIDAKALKEDFLNIVAASRENHLTASSDAIAPGDLPKVAGGKTPNLDQYTVNLTQNARQGAIDPVLARDSEIRQMVDILTRRRQNNPILTGEAGVGKTAVVEGFALRVAQGDVPPPLKNIEVHSLDLALLQAGAGIKGEFENRLKGLIEEVKSSAKPVVLFIDEAHTMIGAGGTAGQGDAANLLKPALARGELKTIAATTWSEYKKYFEKDAALSRRFQVVKIDEPSEAQCMIMMRGIVHILEKHHKVRILDNGLAAAVRLSNRYLAGRQLPDKAVSVLDTASARLALGQSSVPSALEELNRRLQDLEVQGRILQRESAVGTDHAERLKAIGEETQAAQRRLAETQARYEKEKELVEQIRQVREQLEAGSQASESPENGNGEPDTRRARLLAKIGRLNTELDELQGDSPLIGVCVDANIVGEVISAWTGIPVGRMLKDEVAAILALEQTLGLRVLGQDHALEMISQRVRTSRASLEDPTKPIGVFLLIGPSGVGKTETGLTLAETLYGGETNLITINMSEFQEAHTVSLLKGSPPGYVGYGEGGVLTEAVRRRPYSVVLLDEVEKAHPDVMELFYQVFDKGMMEDGEGRLIDFKNCVILLTSNAGTDSMMSLCEDPETAPSPVGMVQAIKPELDKIFKPALLGRLVIVPYYPVRDEVLKRIAQLKLGKIQKRLQENHNIQLNYGDQLLDEVAARCTEVESGARNIDNILTNTLLPQISTHLLSRIAEGQTLRNIEVSVSEEGDFEYSYE